MRSRVRAQLLGLAERKDVAAPAPARLAADLAVGPDGDPFVLAEAADVFVLFKPAHWMVNPETDGDEPAEALEDEVSAKKLQGWVKTHLADFPIAQDNEESHGILHRLDLQTSGAVVCAKTYRGFYETRLQFCTHDMKKEYIFLCHGKVEKEQEIHARIKILKQTRNRSHCIVAKDGKPSFTEVKPIAYLRRARLAGEGEEDLTLCVAKLHTGRTHQIRVHMMHIGHPLVCDQKYGGLFFVEDRAWCERNFLHAYRIGARVRPHDAEGLEDLDVRVPLPRDLLRACEEARLLAGADAFERVRAGDLTYDEHTGLTATGEDQSTTSAPA
jgi:23S rRNA-/tRNA-specific pseudouridylate synthase